MPFIRVIERDEATGPLKALYEDIAAPRGGRLPSPYKAVGLHPEALRALKALNEAVTFGGSTLGRRKEELLATYVSRINDCDY